MPWVPNQIPLIHTCCKNAGAYGAPPYGRTSPRTNNLDGSTDARGTWTKVDHPIRHRSNESPVIVLTSGSPMATPLQCTSSTPCEWCCNLMSRSRRSRTSQASLQGLSIPSIGCHQTPRSRMRFSCEIIHRQRSVATESNGTSLQRPKCGSWDSASALELEAFQRELTNPSLDLIHLRTRRSHRLPPHPQDHSIHCSSCHSPPTCPKNISVAKSFTLLRCQFPRSS